MARKTTSHVPTQSATPDPKVPTAIEEVLEEHSPAEPEPEDDLPLFFDSPESKSIAFAQYDPGNETLIVSFSGSGGMKYGYGNISPAQWREFYQAESKGAYFNKHIRPMSAGRPL